MRAARWVLHVDLDQLQDRVRAATGLECSVGIVARVRALRTTVPLP